MGFQSAESSDLAASPVMDLIGAERPNVRCKSIPKVRSRITIAVLRMRVAANTACSHVLCRGSIQLLVVNCRVLGIRRSAADAHHQLALASG